MRYALRLSIPESPKDPIEGTNIISFDQIDPAIPALSSGRDGVRTFVNFSGDPLVIDFATSREHVKSVALNGRRTAFTWTNGHIVLPGAELKGASNQIEIAFRAGDAPLNRSADFLYALFVPARARLAIPCFDQPDLKARWSLNLEAPAKWATVSNSAEVERRVTGDRVSVRFAETEPLSTYLFSFVVGDFRPRPPSALAAPSACFTGRRMPGRWRGTKTPSSTFMRKPSITWRSTPESRTPSASSTSSSSRPSSSAAWSTPERSSTTRRACCSTSRRHRTSISTAPP